MNTLRYLLLWASISIQAIEAPFLTGPLIAPPGTAISYGNFLLKSYLFFNVETGYYNQKGKDCALDHNIYKTSFQGFYFFGITPWCDISLMPKIFYNRSNGEQSAYFGDLTIGLDVQLLKADTTPYFPGIKFTIQETFPTGRFEQFCPRKATLESTGTGTYATTFDLVFYKLFHLRTQYWLSMTLSSQYTINTPTSVHDFNTYGGGFGAKGIVIPGNTAKTIVSFEWAFNQHWALALDNVYTYIAPTQYKGIEGITFDRLLSQTNHPASQQISLAPSIEYNVGPHFAIIAGTYFSAWGINSPKFQSAAMNLNYFY